MPFIDKPFLFWAWSRPSVLPKEKLENQYMAILKIASMGHPSLREVARPCAKLKQQERNRLAANMIETMIDAHGTGLAAPQVHEPWAMLVYFISGPRSEGIEVPLTTLLDPHFEPLSDKKIYGVEGCLSVPGLSGIVPRYQSIRLQATTLEGEQLDKEVHGFHARVLQHEIDHLKGRLYPQAMDDLSLLVFTSEVMRHGWPPHAKDLLDQSNPQAIDER